MKHRIMIAIGIVILFLITGMIITVFFIRSDSTEGNSKSISILQEPADDITVLTDIQYQITEENNCYFDIAYKDNNTPKPLLVFVHGGTWMGGAKEEMNSYLYTFSALGYTVASLDYDLLDLVKALQGDCTSIKDEETCIAAAVTYLTQHAKEYQIDTSRVILIGHSSGGQLVGRLAEQIASQPQNYIFQIAGVVLISAPSELRYYLYNDIQMIEGENLSFVELSFIFDGVYGTDVIPEINKVDVLYNITEKLPPVLIIHGSDDTLVPVSLSKNLYNTLTDEGVSAELTIIPGGSHSILDNEMVFIEIERFMKQFIIKNEKE